MTTIAKWTCKLEELTKELPPALEWMRSVEYKRGPCVVISSEVTGRFVQFYGGFGRPIVLDVPVGNEGANTPYRSALELALGPPRERLDDLEFFRKTFEVGENERQAIELATASAWGLLIHALELGFEAEVAIEEILAGMASYSRYAES